VEEQGVATQGISRNVQQAAEGTGQVSANIADITGYAERQARTVLYELIAKGCLT
jgi:methyl-accepting chemotaxis protein